MTSWRARFTSRAGPPSSGARTARSFSSLVAGTAQVAASSRMPQLTLSAAGRVAGLDMYGLELPSQASQPPGLVPIGGLVASPFGSPRQESRGIPNLYLLIFSFSVSWRLVLRDAGDIGWARPKHIA